MDEGKAKIAGWPREIIEGLDLIYFCNDEGESRLKGREAIALKEKIYSFAMDISFLILEFKIRCSDICKCMGMSTA